jgi:ppGpp synthetase/RelA/SpoT-type nucleotidyltranferase
MSNKKPEFEAFAAFAKETLNFDIVDKSLQNWINTNIGTARSQIQQHDIVSFIEELVAKHQATSTRLPVNIVSRDFQLHVKSYESIVSKLYRANVLNNPRFHGPPKRGWITPRNMFGRINDLVRSTIVCRHIDEPAKIAQQITAKAVALGLKASSRAQTKDEGYYAHHVYVSVPTNLMDQNWKEFGEAVVLEIQVTTEMQHMLYELTHRFYDKERNLAPKDDPSSWKWDYRSARFSASYLSHTLHLLEGMILQLYEDTEEKKTAIAQHSAAKPASEAQSNPSVATNSAAAVDQAVDEQALDQVQSGEDVQVTPAEGQP